MEFSPHHLKHLHRDKATMYTTSSAVTYIEAWHKMGNLFIFFLSSSLSTEKPSPYPSKYIYYPPMDFPRQQAIIQHHDSTASTPRPEGAGQCETPPAVTLAVYSSYQLSSGRITRGELIHKDIYTPALLSVQQPVEDRLFRDDSVRVFLPRLHGGIYSVADHGVEVHPQLRVVDEQVRQHLCCLFISEA